MTPSSSQSGQSKNPKTAIIKRAGSTNGYSSPANNMQTTTAPSTTGPVEGQLALDVYQTATEIVIVAPIAGVKMSDMQITITEDVLTIKGKRYLEFNIPEEDYLTQECFWGNFSRSIVLPASVDTTKIAASFKDAVLKITMPRSERSKTRLVRIKTDTA